MARPAEPKVPKKNSTQERLRATPFDSHQALDVESHAIRLAIWKRFEQAKIIDELLTKDEYAFINETWQTGVACSCKTSEAENICRVFADENSRGLKVELNEKFIDSFEEPARRLFLESVIRSNLEGFGTLFYRSRALLPLEIDDSESKPLQTMEKNREISKP